jgi:hypothetical protein
MNDAQRYRMNAAECLSAAERCGPAYRDLTVSIAETWLALVRHEDAMDELLATLEQSQLPVSSRQSFHARSSPAPARRSLLATWIPRFFTNVRWAGSNCER